MTRVGNVKHHEDGYGLDLYDGHTFVGTRRYDSRRETHIQGWLILFPRTSRDWLERYFADVED